MTVEKTIPESTDDMILPNGWDGESDLLTPESDDPTIDMEEGDEPATEEAEADGAEESETDEEEGDPTIEPETPTKARIKYKFNHEELEMDEDEAAPIIQKGLNYDKVVAKAQTLEQKQAEFEALAKELQFNNADEMIQAAKANYENARVKAYTDEFNSQVEEMVNVGIPQSIAETVARTNLADKEPSKAKAPEPVINPVDEEAKRLDALRDKDLDEFVKRYPGVTKIPPEVMDEYQKSGGLGLTAIYADFKTKEATKENKILKQNQKSASKAPVGGATKHGSAQTKAEDPFTMGFDSDDF